MSLTVKVGDQIPSVGLRATDGYLLNLRSFVTKQPVAFLFFGGPTLAGTGGRRGKQAAQALAEGYERLREAGIAVVGVSCDSEEQQADFVAKARLPYLLFSDERRTAVEMLGIPTVAAGANVNVSKPLVLVVDRDGEIRAIVERIDPEWIVDKILRVLSTPTAASGAQGAHVQEAAPGA